MRFNSIRFKASVLYSTIQIIILVVFSAVVFFSVRAMLYHDLNQDLKIKAEEVAGILSAYQQVQRVKEYPVRQILGILKGEGAAASQKMIIDELWRSQLEVLNLKNDFINILNINGRAVLSSNNFKKNVEDLFKKQFPFVQNDVIYKTLTSEGYQLRAINLPIKFYDSPLVIQIGTPVESISNILDGLLAFMIVTVIAFLLLTSFVGRIFVEDALRPVREVSDLANSISYKDLNQRIEEKEIDVEMKQLVTSFNSMINRLAQSFGHINEFSSYAAHELKTPLAIMRGEIELALEEDKTTEYYKNLLNGCLEEIDHMIKVIKDLLLLAKLDYKPEIFKFEKLALVPFLDEIYEHSKVLAETKKIKVRKDFPQKEIILNADKVHLRRLFFNILSNAIKFTPSRGSIDIKIALREAKCFIDITDTGKGISKGNLKRVFDKFFRVSDAQQQEESSVGLGLNIALSIAEAHGGKINVRSNLQQGTTFTVALPLA
ncbi:MAG: ATP-binding protein [Candidatus Aceula meridiana]|nr:ATP-binding protein [Candidatus Aceula meridiana]